MVKNFQFDKYSDLKEIIGENPIKRVLNGIKSIKRIPLAEMLS